MEQFSAFQVVQIATGVLLGNIMTLCLYKGYKRLDGPKTWTWETAGIYLGPLAMIVIVLIGSTS